MDRANNLPARSSDSLPTAVPSRRQQADQLRVLPGQGRSQPLARTLLRPRPALPMAAGAQGSSNQNINDHEWGTEHSTPPAYQPPRPSSSGGVAAHANRMLPIQRPNLYQPQQPVGAGYQPFSSNHQPIWSNPASRLGQHDGPVDIHAQPQPHHQPLDLQEDPEDATVRLGQEEQLYEDEFAEYTDDDYEQQEYVDEQGSYEGEYAHQPEQDNYDDSLNQDLDQDASYVEEQDTPLKGKGPMPSAPSRPQSVPLPLHPVSNQDKASQPQQQPPKPVASGSQLPTALLGQRAVSPDVNRSSIAMQLLDRVPPEASRHQRQLSRKSSNESVIYAPQKPTNAAAANVQQTTMAAPTNKRTIPFVNQPQNSGSMANQQNGDIKAPDSHSAEDDLDYTMDELEAMSYSDLEAQSFDENPRANLAQEHQQGELASRLEKVRTLSRDKQAQFFSNQTLENWEESGEWFLGCFQNLLSRFVQARKDKRELAVEFEKQVSARHSSVEEQAAGIDKVLEDMRSSGMGVLKNRSTPTETAD